MEIQTARHFADLLGMIKASRKRGTGQFSYHQLAEKLAYRSPRSIAMVRKGQRPPSSAMVKSVCDYLKATPAEREFILLLAEKAKRFKKGQSFAAIDEKLDRFRALKALSPTGAKIPGVSIEIQPEANESLRKRVNEMISELTLEFGEF